MSDEESRKKIARMTQEERGRRILEGTNNSKTESRNDGFSNVLNKYGTGKDSSMYYKFDQEASVDDMTLTSLYEGNGLFAKIIDKPAEEAVKHGLDIDYGDEDIKKYVEKRLDELEYNDKMATAEKWARLYGGAIAIMLIDDGRGLEEPLDIQHARSIDEIRVFERAIVQPDYTGLYAFNFEDSIKNHTKMGEPQRYFVFSTYGYFTVHASRCMIFRNSRMPEHVSNANYRYWGIPEYVKIRKALEQTEVSHGDGVKLLERSVQAIYKASNLSNLVSTNEGENQVLQRLELIDLSRGILNSIAIDKDEDYDFKSLPLSGVKDILDSTCCMLSAVTNIPQTILFGKSPDGMNATGESDLENYYNMVENIQAMNFKSNSRRLISIILKQGLLDGKITKIPDFDVQFAKLWSLSEQDQATVDKSKADTELVKSQIASGYITAGVIDPTEVRKSLAKSGDFEIDDMIDNTGDTVQIPEGSMDIPGINAEGATQGTQEKGAGVAAPKTTEAAGADRGANEGQPGAIDNTISQIKEKVAGMLRGDSRYDGGAGSGNHGHAGVPGHRGGSAAGSGPTHVTSAEEDGYLKTISESRFGSPEAAAAAKSLRDSLQKSGKADITEKSDEYSGTRYTSYVKGADFQENAEIQKSINAGTGFSNMSQDDYCDQAYAHGEEPKLSEATDPVSMMSAYSADPKLKDLNAYGEKTDGKTPVYDLPGSMICAALQNEEIVQYGGHDQHINPKEYEKGEKASEKAIGDMSAEERQAVVQYTKQYGPGVSSEVNPYMRGQKEGSASTKSASEKLNTALDHEIGSNITVTRGSDMVEGVDDPKVQAMVAQVSRGNFSKAGQLRDAIVGKEVTNAAPTSTTIGDSSRQAYGQMPVQYVFETPEDAKAVNISKVSSFGAESQSQYGSLGYLMGGGSGPQSESEVLFKPGMKYQVSDVKFVTYNASKSLGKSKMKGQVIVKCKVMTDKSGKRNDNDDIRKGVGVLVIKDGKILCGIRTDTGEICGPGGHIQEGENPEDAARRETMEEFGVYPLDLYPLGTYKAPGGEHTVDSTLFWTDRYSGDPKTDDEEMKDLRWMSLQELSDLNDFLFDPFRDSLQQLCETFSGKGLTNKQPSINVDGAPMGNKNAAGPHNGGGSASGENHFKSGFSKNNLDNHWGGKHDHSKQYPGMNREQYAKRALDLVQKPTGENILGYKNKDGQICRYDKSTNDYVKGKPDQGIATMFKPRDKEEYYKRMMKKEGGIDHE